MAVDSYARMLLYKTMKSTSTNDDINKAISEGKQVMMVEPSNQPVAMSAPIASVPIASAPVISTPEVSAPVAMSARKARKLLKRSKTE